MIRHRPAAAGGRTEQRSPIRRLRCVLGAGAIAGIVFCSLPSASAAPLLDTNIGGWAENSVTSSTGDVFVSNLTGNRVQRLQPGTGGLSTVAELPNPGGLALRGSDLYVAFGNSPLSVVTAFGGIARVDLQTGKVTRLISGFGEANGLDILRDGDVVFSVTAGPGAGVHRFDPVARRDRLLTSSVFSANGLAVGPDGYIYVGSTVTGTISRVDPVTGLSVVAAGISVLVDDFGFLPDGRIVGATTLGQIDIIDLAAGSVRPIGSGRLAATSVKPSGTRLIVTTALGTVSSIPAPTPR